MIKFSLGLGGLSTVSLREGCSYFSRKSLLQVFLSSSSSFEESTSWYDFRRALRENLRGSLVGGQVSCSFRGGARTFLRRCRGLWGSMSFFRGRRRWGTGCSRKRIIFEGLNRFFWWSDVVRRFSGDEVGSEVV
jgi:hypothetical protein